MRDGPASRRGAQVEQVLGWIEQARPPRGAFGRRYRSGATASLCRCAEAWHRRVPRPRSPCSTQGASVWEPFYLGQMPKSGQGTITDQLSGLLKAVLSRVDSHSLRLVYVTDEGHHPSTYYHHVLKHMTDPRCPWRCLEWIRVVDFYHACGYVQQLADTIFGSGAEAQSWRQAEAPCAQDQGRWRRSGASRRRRCVGVVVFVVRPSSTIKPIATSNNAPSGCAITLTSVSAYPWALESRRAGCKIVLLSGSNAQGCHGRLRGPSDFGPAGDQVEPSLARGSSEVLGVQANTCRPTRTG